MKILGICSDVWVTSACLLEDGKIIAAAAEERFNRQKMSMDFPIKAIEYCLKQAGCKLEDVDYVALGWNPGFHIKKTNHRFSSAARWRAEYLYSIPNQLSQLLEKKEFDYIEQHLKQQNSEVKIIYVSHHLAHGANGFFLSPFDEAAILSMDGRGEDDTALFARGKGNKIEEIKTVAYPHSMGLFYGTITEFLGFTPDSDEWKVMALASYANGDNQYYQKMKKLITLKNDGTFELDLRYFNYYVHDQLHLYSDKFVESFGEPRQPDTDLDQRHYEIVAACQKISEEVAGHMLEWLHQETGLENLIVNGGFFMNSVYNGKIIETSPFKNIFISSCPDDSGTSIGAALYTYNHILDKPERNEQTHNYYGPEFTKEEIEQTIKKFGLKSEQIENIEKEAAKLVSEGKIIGWFQGRMEFGQRALGNRSIIADPRQKNMKDKVNAVIKYRESFRPFAPSILVEHVTEYFECDEKVEVPFMEKVYMIKNDMQAVIPAVTHHDGSGRLQTVNKDTNPRYYKLIEEFKKLTGVPVVLNTSFNVKGDPIACTPADAIKTFYSCGLDALVLGNYLIKK